MKAHFRGAALLAVVILILYGGEAGAAERSPWYIGAGMGHTAFSVNSGQLNSIASSIRGRSAERFDSGNSGIRIYGGVRLNKFFALEAGYTDLGQIAFAVPPHPCLGICPAVVTFSGSGEITADGWNLNAVWSFPLTERFELGGKLGAFRSTVKLQAMGPFTGVSFPDRIPDRIPDALTLQRTVYRTRPLYGAGIKYRVTPEFSFTLNWERIDNLGSAEKTGEIDVKFWSAGVRHDF